MSQLTIPDVPAGTLAWIDGAPMRLVSTVEGEWDLYADLSAGDHDVVAVLPSGERRALSRVWIAEDESLTLPFAVLERSAAPSAPPARSPWRALLLAGAIVGTVGGVVWLATNVSTPSPARSPA